MTNIAGLQYAAALFTAAAIASPSAQSQTPAPEQIAPPRFEVASVKPNKSGEPFPLLGSSRGQYRVNNVPLRTLIQAAFQVQSFQIVNAPEWTANERFDITAKIPQDVQPTPGVQTTMLRALLEERFKLVTHRETRERPVYALVLARADGKVPPGLEPAPPECAQGALPPPLQPGPRPPCSTNFGTGLVTSGGITMEAFARMLSGPLQVGRSVLDRTGLAGQFQFDLKYTPDQMRNVGGNSPPPDFPVIDPNEPSLVTALREQLGLKLESTCAPVEVLMIDSVDRPTSD